MVMKEILFKLQPIQLYIILTLSIVYFLIQLFLSHISHALTLLVNSYHMLCNIIALTGCIITIKHSKENGQREKGDSTTQSSSAATGVGNFVEVKLPTAEVPLNIQHERSLKNTFGWTRIDVLTMLIVCIFLASLCFSLLVEALQTLVHIDHQHAIHHPVKVLILGCLGLVLNGLCYLLIGGYTYHQGSFFHLTKNGNVVLDRVIIDNGHGERSLTRNKNHKNEQEGNQQESANKQSTREMFRDICSSLFVILCSIIVYFADSDQVSKFVDPVIAILSCFVLLYLSYPYMKQSGLILLQTIPDCIDIDCFKKNLLVSFKDIVNVHDLHIWQLSASKYVSTAHIIFQNQLVYTKIMDDVVEYFHEQGINIVTIQPEFQDFLPNSPLLMSTNKADNCLMQCRGNGCLLKHCCRRDEPPTTNGNKIDKEAVVGMRYNKSFECSTEHIHEEKCTHHTIAKEIKMKASTNDSNQKVGNGSTKAVHLENGNKISDDKDKTAADAEVIVENRENENKEAAPPTTTNEIEMKKDSKSNAILKIEINSKTDTDNNVDE